MSEYNGTKTPVPVAFYPKGKVYGMQPVTRNGQSAVMALEGTYDDPQTVADYYQRFYQDTANAQSLRVEYSSPSWGSATSAFRLWKARADSASGYMIISVWASSEGFSRDVAKWLPDAPPNAAAGGDPKETMIWLLIKWK